MNKIINYIFLFISFGLFAQKPVSSAVDSTAIHIGSAFTYTIEAQGKNDAKITFPEGEQMGDFEVLESFPADTLIQEQHTAYTKKYLLTQFDSGSYHISRQSVYIDGKNYQTDLHKINVLPVAVDTLKQPMYDIKTVVGSSVDTSYLIYYIIAIVVCILIGLLVFWLIRKQQNKNLTEDDLFRTPLERATAKLQQLDEKRWVTDGNIKSYYSELTDIAREYIEEVFEIPAKESTSSDLIRLLKQTVKNKKIKLRPQTIKDLQTVLQTADLVKFAKSEPTISEVEKDRKVIEDITSITDKAIPKFSEEQSERVKKREQRYRKRKQIRTWVPVGVSAVLLLLVGSVYAYSSLMDNMNFSLFASNKKLYQQEWVTSNYGYPPMQIQTPEALLRVETSATKTENLQSPIASFIYQNLSTKLSVVLSTTITQSTEGIDVNGLLKSKLGTLNTAFSATDVKVDSDKVMIHGIEGIHAKGSFNGKLANDLPTEDYEFELFIFVQKEGVQELSVMFKKGDEYGQKIADKILESVQFNPNQE